MCYLLKQYAVLILIFEFCTCIYLKVYTVNLMEWLGITCMTYNIIRTFSLVLTRTTVFRFGGMTPNQSGSQLKKWSVYKIQTYLQNEASKTPSCMNKSMCKPAVHVINMHRNMKNIKMIKLALFHNSQG